jgi:transcriptional regulator GlxA family with amidase domain
MFKNANYQNPPSSEVLLSNIRRSETGAVERSASGNNIRAISLPTGDGAIRGIGDGCTANPAASCMDQRVHIVIELMTSDLCRVIYINVLAQKVNLSGSRLHHLFKAETGTTPAQYLRTMRLSRAKTLLEKSLLNVKQIMAKVGMNDRSHFEREFKKAYGVTPTQCRGETWLVERAWVGVARA